MKTKFKQTSFKHQKPDKHEVSKNISKFGMVLASSTLTGIMIGGIGAPTAAISVLITGLGISATTEVGAAFVYIIENFKNAKKKNKQSKLTDIALKAKSNVKADINESSIPEEWKKEGVTKSVIISHNNEKIRLMDGKNKNGYNYHAIQNMNTGDLKVIKA